MPTTSPLISDQEARELLRCSRKTLYRWRSAGLVPFVTMGRLIRYRVEDIQRIQKTGLPPENRAASVEDGK